MPDPVDARRLPLEPAYGPPVGAEDPRVARIGQAGEYPFTRGLHRSGYRGRPWTIRQFAGFGNAMQTNERYRMILDAGGGGLSVAFDMPTLMVVTPTIAGSWRGWSLRRCYRLRRPTWNCCSKAFARRCHDVDDDQRSRRPDLLHVRRRAERQGVAHGKLNGTLQTDIFKEYMHKKSGCSRHSRIFVLSVTCGVLRE